MVKKGSKKGGSPPVPGSGGQKTPKKGQKRGPKKTEFPSKKGSSPLKKGSKKEGLGPAPGSKQVGKKHPLKFPYVFFENVR